MIADLSLLNPNAFYEIGIRHMTQKPIIHMQLATERPPIDVSLYRAIKFLRRKPSDLVTARADLKRAIEAVLADGYEVVNPITSVRGRMKLEERATSEQRVLIDQMSAIQSRLDNLEAFIQVAQENAMLATNPPSPSDVVRNRFFAALFTPVPQSGDATRVSASGILGELGSGTRTSSSKPSK